MPLSVHISLSVYICMYFYLQILTSIHVVSIFVRDH